MTKETRANNPQYSSKVEERIERVLNNLQVEDGVKGNFGSDTLGNRMKFYNTPAVSIAVVNEGEIEWARGFGKSDLKSNAPTDIETMFQAASISKPVFALAIMKLKERGVIDLDKDVNEYLTSWKVPKNGDWQPKITLRQLLSHTAGLTINGFLGYTKEEKLPTILQILNGEEPANSAKVRVDILPGTQFKYSGGGTMVAQLVISDLLKKPLPKIIEEELFRPLNFKQSVFSQPLPTDFKYKVATAYPYKNDPVNGSHYIYPELGAAGLWSTPTELATIMIEVQKGIKGNSHLFKKEMLEEMLTPQKMASQIGIGFKIESKDKFERFGHEGSNVGFMSKLIGYKNNGKGVVVMLNSLEGRIIFDEIIYAVAMEYKWPDYLPKETKFEPVDESILSYIGTYGDYKLDYTKGKLFLIYQNQEPLELKKTTDGIYKNKYMNFVIKVRDKQMEFTQAGQTKIFGKK